MKQIQEADFKLQNGQWRLKFENSKKYAKLFMQPLIENKDEIFRYIQRYYNAFMKGCAGNDFPEFDIGSCL